MTLYVYDTETMEIVEEITGESNAECEERAAHYDWDVYGATYATDGLIEVQR